MYFPFEFSTYRQNVNKRVAILKYIIRHIENVLGEKFVGMVLHFDDKKRMQEEIKFFV